MNGKDKCRILKQIRSEIAKQNDIDLVIEECPHKGDCPGTCPRCEADVRFLEQALEKRRRAGLGVKLAGVTANLVEAVGAAVYDAVHYNPVARAIRRKNNIIAYPEELMGEAQDPLARTVEKEWEEKRAPRREAPASAPIPGTASALSDDDSDEALRRALSDAERRLARGGDDDTGRAAAGRTT